MLPRELLEIVASFLPPRGFVALARASTQTWRLLDRDEPWTRVWCQVRNAGGWWCSLTGLPQMQVLWSIFTPGAPLVPLAAYARTLRFVRRHLDDSHFVPNARCAAEFAVAFSLLPADHCASIYCVGEDTHGRVWRHAEYFSVRITTYKSSREDVHKTFATAEAAEAHVAHMLGWTPSPPI